MILTDITDFHGNVEYTEINGKFAFKTTSLTHVSLLLLNLNCFIFTYQSCLSSGIERHWGGETQQSCCHHLEMVRSKHFKNLLSFEFNLLYTSLFATDGGFQVPSHTPLEVMNTHFYRSQYIFAKVMFLHVPVCPQGGVGDLQAHTQREVEGSGWGGGMWSPGPHPGRRLRDLAGGGLQAHT